MDITVSFLGEKTQKADVFVVGFFAFGAQLPRELQKIDPAAFERLKTAVQKNRFQGKAEERFVSYDPSFVQADEVVFLGLGNRDSWSTKKLRNVIGAIYHAAKSNRAKKVRLLADSFVSNKLGIKEISELIPETLLLSHYSFDGYKSRKKDHDANIQSVDLLFSKSSLRNDIKDRLNRAKIVAESVNFTRNLINEPANVMSPSRMAEEARKLADEAKLKCQVFGAREIKNMKMGGIIAVSQGSHEPPQLIILEYGSQHKNRGTLCLVGKGVCFDTGGISIKPSKDMEKMKYDMSGAAAVLGIIKAVSRLKSKIHVVGIAPCVENMPGGGAQRPGDIIKMHNGKSVEVINTDAEGRLILADALAYAERFNPKALIDMATLTGAVVIALADQAIGLMGTDSALVEKLRKAGEVTGERCWELPLWEEYGEMIKGSHSDIQNVGSGVGGGTITAGMFLKEFVPVKSWAHLDIAGVAWTNSNKPYNVKGATGIGVRLLLEFIRNWR